MAILRSACGEDIEFPRRHELSVTSTTAARFRSAFVRGCLFGSDLQTAGTVLADGKPLAATITSGWLSCRLFFDYSGSDTTKPRIGLGGSALLGGIYVGTAGTLTKLGIFKVTSTGTATLLDSEPGTSFGKQILHRIDMQVTNWNNGSTGNVKVYLNGAPDPVINFTGDLTASGVTTLDRVRWVASGAGDGNAWLSEVIVADEDTRGLPGVYGLYPNAAGDTNTWTAGTYTDVDESTLSDVDQLASDTTLQEVNFGVTDLPAGDFGVRSVEVYARSGKGASGPGTLKLGVKSGGTVNTSDYAQALALGTTSRLMLVNPVTGLNWTHAEVDAVLVDMKSAT